MADLLKKVQRVSGWKPFAQQAERVDGASITKRSPEWERRRLTAMQEYFGADTQLADIDSVRSGEWRDWRLAGDENQDVNGVSGSTVQREASLLRNLFSLATDEWRWNERNPFKGVRLSKEDEDSHQLWRWRWQQIKRVLRTGQR